MAKVLALFLGLLLTTLCAIVGLGDGAVAPQEEIQMQVPLRTQILQIAEREIGVREATGNNDGERVETYLRYTGLGKNHAWCAAFACWSYGQAGLAEPNNPWSPALFPKAKTYWIRGQQVTASARPADIFGIYGASAKRINHVGLVWAQEGAYLVTIEGNSNNRVESRRRPLKTLYALSNWLGD